jgi:rare lipoprotein A
MLTRGNRKLSISGFCGLAALCLGLTGCDNVDQNASGALATSTVETTAFDTELKQFGHQFGQYKLGDSYTINGVRYSPVESLSYVEEGNASWYGTGLEGNVTTNGESFDPSKMTAAHRTLPFSTVVRVTNLENSLSTLVRINDRGPFINDRLIDLSQSAAAVLGFANKASARVKLEVDEHRTRQVASKTGGVVGNAGSNGQGLAGTAAKPLVSANTPLIDRSYSSTRLPSPSQSNSPAKVPLNKPLSLLPPTKPITTSVGSQSVVSATPQNSTVSGKGFFVHAGSFSNPQNAANMRQKLSAYGTVGVEVATVNGKSVQRVLIGPMGTQQDAQRMLGKVIGAGSFDARIIKRSSDYLAAFN